MKIELPDLTEEQIKIASIETLRDAYRKLLAETCALRELISTRTRAAVEELRKQGLKFNGNLPYGMESDPVTKKVRDSIAEQKLIAEIKQLHERGLTLRGIARTLEEQGHLNRKNRKLDAKQISRILAASKDSTPLEPLEPPKKKPSKTQRPG